eukprot:6196044-Pleurochrysis_carterae.AAC.1
MSLRQVPAAIFDKSRCLTKQTDWGRRPARRYALTKRSNANRRQRLDGDIHVLFHRKQLYSCRDQGSNSEPLC